MRDMAAFKGSYSPFPPRMGSLALQVRQGSCNIPAQIIR